MADRGRSLAQAVATSLFLLALVIICYLLGRPAFFVLAAAVVLFAFFELMDAVTRKAQRPQQVLFGLCCCLALMAAAYWHKPEWLLAAAGATPAGCLLLCLLPPRGPTAAAHAAWTVLGVAWIGGGGAAAVAILALPDEGLQLLILFVLVAAADDICAYFLGTAFGKHRLAPSISPSKTWEGLAGGVGGAVAVSLVLIPLWTRLGPAQALGVAAIVAVLAPLGDLVESLVKRELGVKDSGRLLPGHGGMLDRLDAIIFCAPAVFLYLHFIVS